jgi:hypothetical protein
MTMDLSSFDIEETFSKLTLTKSFEYETRRPLEDCIHNLRLLQPTHDWNIHFGGPRTVHEVVISQFDDHMCYYDVSTKYRGRNRGGYSRTAHINGKMVYNPETGVTKISGESKLNGVSVVILLVAILIFCLFTLSYGFPAFFVLFALGAFAYAVYTMVQDQAHLLRVVQEL